MLACTAFPDGAIALMTTSANAEMRRIHDRMPIILPRAVWDDYLDPSVRTSESISPYLAPLPDGSLALQAVDSLVNNARHETPDCLRPARSGGPLELDFGD